MCAALAAVVSGPARAQHALDAIGGAGGGAFHAPCAATEALAGFELRTGHYVDALRPLCVAVGGPRDIGAPADSHWHGGSGGGVTRIACPGDRPIVTGLFVGQHPGEGVVDNLLLYCSVATGSSTSGNATSAFARPAAAGDTSASHQQTQGCPQGQVAVGVHGRSGLYVDAIGLLCDAPRLAATSPANPVGKSIGRIGTSSTGPRKPICDAARDARARNSPAAASLEAQCLASRTQVTALGKVIAAPANTPGPPVPPTSPPIEATPVDSPLPREPAPAPAPAPAPQTRREVRDASVQSLIGVIVATVNASRADGATGASDPPASVRERAPAGNNRRRSDLPPRNGAGTSEATMDAGMRPTSHSADASAWAASQPANSVRILVRYPTTYGYKDREGGPDAAPNSCGAFHISAFPASGVRAPELTRIDMQPVMRHLDDMFVCEYLVLDQPLDVPIQVRVAMSDQRAAGSAAWLAGSQAQPPPGQRRTVADGDRQVVLTASRPWAALDFQMVYAGSQ